MTKQPDKTHANQMWGGRFDTAPSNLMQQINASIDIDKRLYKHDIQGSIAHAQMLGKTNIITADESQKIIQGLKDVLQDIENGAFTFDPALEDIHMNIEHALTQKIGDIGGKLHTARSRNDQVATAFRLWLRDASGHLTNQIQILIDALQTLATDNQNTLMPGFTHLQVAQPVTLKMHLEAYVEMFTRDISRLNDASKRANECPLGACALAGTLYPIDRDMTAKELGFTKPMPNTMDAVSARDFVLEFLSACAVYAIHLSRLAEELILWSSTQFNYIRLSDAYTSGSSIMPQKKNPDAAELIRAKSGMATASLVQMLTIMKALPLCYNKDMQDDKKCTFDTYDTMLLCTKAMHGMLTTLSLNPERMKQDALSGYSTATRLADWLVMNLNIPFRQAHHLTGQIVKLAESKDLPLSELPLSDYQSIHPSITQDAISAVTL